METQNQLNNIFECMDLPQRKVISLPFTDKEIVWVGYIGTEKFFTVDIFRGTSWEAQEYYQDEGCYKIITLNSLSKKEGTIIAGCAVPTQLHLLETT